MNKMIKFPLILALTGTICATALGVVYQVANPIIEERVNAAANEAIGAVIPGAKGADITKDYSKDKDLLAKYKISTIYEVKKDGKVIGNGFKLSTAGFGGQIETLVILDDTKILGVKVLNHSETPNKFESVVNAKFEQAFADKKYEDASKIDNVTGASITSKGIRTAVMNAADAYKEIILGESVGPKDVVSQAEFDKLGYTGETFVKATDKLKEVQEDTYKTDFVGSGKHRAGITDAYYRMDASGNKVGYVYYFESWYNCEINDGGRLDQSYRGLFSFDLDHKNSKLVILDSTDSLSSVPQYKPDFSGKPNVVPLPQMPWLEQFNGLDIDAIANQSASLPDIPVDVIGGASTTPKSLFSTIEIICVNHIDF